MRGGSSSYERTARSKLTANLLALVSQRMQLMRRVVMRHGHIHKFSPQEGGEDA